MKLQDLTKKQKFIIAEFYYSYVSDILIKSDAERLFEVLMEKGVLDKRETLNTLDPQVANNLRSCLIDNITNEDLLSIMDQYYKHELM